MIMLSSDLLTYALSLLYASSPCKATNCFTDFQYSILWQLQLGNHLLSNLDSIVLNQVEVKLNVLRLSFDRQSDHKLHYIVLVRIGPVCCLLVYDLSLIHISEPTRPRRQSRITDYA